MSKRKANKATRNKRMKERRMSKPVSIHDTKPAISPARKAFQNL